MRGVWWRAVSGTRAPVARTILTSGKSSYPLRGGYLQAPAVGKRATCLLIRAEMSLYRIEAFSLNLFS